MWLYRHNDTRDLFHYEMSKDSEIETTKDVLYHSLMSLSYCRPDKPDLFIRILIAQKILYWPQKIITNLMQGIDYHVVMFWPYQPININSFACLGKLGEMVQNSYRLEIALHRYLLHT